MVLGKVSSSSFSMLVSMVLKLQRSACTQVCTPSFSLSLSLSLYFYLFLSLSLSVSLFLFSLSTFHFLLFVSCLSLPFSNNKMNHVCHFTFNAEQIGTFNAYRSVLGWKSVEGIPHRLPWELHYSGMNHIYRIEKFFPL